jgi:Arc/MetJ family transcription regulator
LARKKDQLDRRFEISSPASLIFPILSIGDIMEWEGATVSLRKARIEIDEELLAAAQRVLPTATLQETIDAAFLESLRAARREEVEALSTMRGMDLSDPDVRFGAWPSRAHRPEVFE